MKKFYLVLFFSLVLSNLAAQSKKEVIETLTSNIDSLNIIISRLRLRHITELESKESRISTLRAEIVQLESEKLLHENYIDSLQKLNLELLDKNQIANSQILVLNDSLFALKKGIVHYIDLDKKNKKVFILS
jgi:TolA-binding protein